MKTSGSKWIARGVALCGLIGNVGNAAAESMFTVEELPAGQGAAYSTVVNEKGKVLVDVYRSTDQSFVSALCNAAKCKQLPPKSRSTAYVALNDLGDLAGTSRFGDSDWAVRRLAGSDASEKIVKGHAWGISRDGVTVGETEAGKAFYFDTSLHLLPTLGGDKATARAVVNMGNWDLVAGASATSQGKMHAVVYDNAENHLSDLGTLPGGDTSIAYAVNFNGEAVGCSNDAPGSDAMVAAVYSVGAVFRLDAQWGTGVQSCALAFIDPATVVGWVLGPWQTEKHAFIYEGNQLFDLNERLSTADQEKYILLSATGINSAGQIAVTALRKSNGKTVAIRLTPQP